MKGLGIFGLVSYILLGLFITCMVCVWQAVAQVPMEPQSALEVVALLPKLEQAFEVKNYGMIAVIVLMTLTWAIKRFVLPSDGSKKHFLPGASGFLGALFGAAASPDNPMSGALNGLMLGASASGFYDMAKLPKEQFKEKIGKKLEKDSSQ